MGCSTIHHTTVTGSMLHRSANLYYEPQITIVILIYPKILGFLEKESGNPRIAQSYNAMVFYDTVSVIIQKIWNRSLRHSECTQFHIDRAIKLHLRCSRKPKSNAQTIEQFFYSIRRCNGIRRSFYHCIGYL